MVPRGPSSIGRWKRSRAWNTAQGRLPLVTASPMPNANGRDNPTHGAQQWASFGFGPRTCLIPPKVRGWGFNEPPPYPAGRWLSKALAGTPANGKHMKRGLAGAPYQETHLGIVELAPIPNKLTEKSHTHTHTHTHNYLNTNIANTNYTVPSSVAQSVCCCVRRAGCDECDRRA